MIGRVRVEQVFDPVPRIIHQTWKTDQIPEAWAPYQQSWRRCHPEWSYVLWTDEDNRRLIAERYPWFLPTFNGYSRDIQRVDAAKYFILYTHGGLYADLDCECMRPVDPLMSRGGAIVGRTHDGVIDCAILASPPGHPFWETVFRQLQTPHRGATLLRGVPGFDASHVLLSTGPRMMTRAVREYVAGLSSNGAPAPALTIHEPTHFSSRSWLDRDKAFDEPAAFVRHHYSDSWLLPSEKRVVKWLTKTRLRWAAGLLLLAASLLAATW